ncbi:3-hydroxyacyl-CoA dehydrogenase family protein [Rufibacter sp. LB8]|uniref:3-hydroxyacyl-CoA dehydrogenase family protein n=1 Tax=Rufibacter sp. LB8 TaxID=2777781 RepID=UPI00178C7B87|nr:3-hydroxyacyl-CoA dehydrogenase family protein [Rufibacter sp. LB8]
MNTLVLATPEQEAEFSLKFPNRFYLHIQDPAELAHFLPQAHLVFDFLLHEQPERLKDYNTAARGEKLIVFCNAAKLQLAALAAEHGPVNFHLCGMNALPTFFNREVLELSVLREASKREVDKACVFLATLYELVQDRVGMVTPRVICMIINEACYTLQEGTATQEDIDQGMKLGTNYPFGPFEWANKIGIKNVYELLQAVYEDTKDERYKICPLLKTKYLKGEEF